MMIMICGYERVLSNDNYLKSLIDSLLTSILESGQHVIIAASKPGASGIIHNELTEKVLSVNNYLPFKREREKLRIQQEIRKAKPDIVLSFNESYTPDFPEVVLITKPIAKLNALAKASRIVLSDHLQQQLASALSFKKLSLEPGVWFKPVAWDKREYIKQQYAAGREYFYCSAYNSSIEQLTIILKAFSLFKKWQNSSVKLLLAETCSISERVKKLLEHYLYRTDVVLIEETDFNIEADLVASSFVIIYMPEEDSLGLRVLNYLQAEVPVITRATGAIEEMAARGVMYCDSRNIEDIATKMKLVYKDEKFRTQVINEGRNALKGKLNDPGSVDIVSLLKQKPATQ